MLQEVTERSNRYRSGAATSKFHPLIGRARPLLLVQGINDALEIADPTRK